MVDAACLLHARPLAALVPLLVAAAAPADRSLGGRDFADPFVLRDGAVYYAFATGARGENVQAARSRDLASWSPLPDALPRLPRWAARAPGTTWAPSVLRRGDAYVLYYVARDTASAFQCISRALSAAPAGPYFDDSERPLVCDVGGDRRLCGSIDPSPFVDDGGQPYLLWKSDENSSSCNRAPRIWSQPLSDDGLRVVGRPAALLSADRPWEGPIIEGPSMVRRHGRYLLFYSASLYESASYAIGYATCAGPTGPCDKQTRERPLFASAGAMLGPGGQEFFTDPSGET